MTTTPHLRGDSVRPSLLGSTASSVSAPASGRGSTSAAVQIEQALDEHFPSLWRFARRLGVGEADVDDVLQEVIMVLAQRIGDVPPGKRKSFLFGSTFRIASAHRRKRANAREIAPAEDEPEPASLAAGPDEQLEDARARALLEAILDGLPLDVRAVFVLFEIEELTMREIAVVLDLPPGTVASRLRRGREHFEAAVARLKNRDPRSTR